MPLLFTGLFNFCFKLGCLYLNLCVIREKDVDITFAQDAIDEYKVLCVLIVFLLLIYNDCKRAHLPTSSFA